MADPGVVVDPGLGLETEVERRWRAGSHPLLRFALWRTASGLLVLLLVSILIFVATSVIPGDPASVVLGKQASPAAVAELREDLGLSDPLYQRYGDWIGGLLSGDLGVSAVQEAQGQTTDVWSLVSERLVNTAILAFVAAALLIPLSILLGVYAAVRVGGASDQSISASTLVLVSVPEFVVGSFLVLIFFSALDVLPALSLVPPGETALSDPQLLILPVLTLLVTSLAWTTRLVRAGMLEKLDSEYVQMARLNGLNESKVIYRYALRNALAPSVQVFAQSAQFLVGGVIVTEIVFGYPGIGSLLVNAVATRDFTVVQSVAMLVATFYLVMNIVADFLVMLLVPKLRTGG
jgi:peptide/nickel transport system permease protein